jgi:type II secretory pathway pseudopilin PulG
VIVGIVIALASVQYARSPAQALEDEARRLALVLELARDEAMTRGLHARMDRRAATRTGWNAAAGKPLRLLTTASMQSARGTARLRSSESRSPEYPSPATPRFSLPRPESTPRSSSCSRWMETACRSPAISSDA